jgi:hypothetical protein
MEIDDLQGQGRRSIMSTIVVVILGMGDCMEVMEAQEGRVTMMVTQVAAREYLRRVMGKPGDDRDLPAVIGRHRL